MKILKSYTKKLATIVKQNKDFIHLMVTPSYINIIYIYPSSSQLTN